MSDTVSCQSCGSENEAGRKCCGECGSALATSCSSCGTPNPPEIFERLEATPWLERLDSVHVGGQAAATPA